MSAAQRSASVAGPWHARVLPPFRSLALCSLSLAFCACVCSVSFFLCVLFCFAAACGPQILRLPVVARVGATSSAGLCGQQRQQCAVLLRMCRPSGRGPGRARLCCASRRASLARHDDAGAADGGSGAAPTRSWPGRRCRCAWSCSCGLRRVRCHCCCRSVSGVDQWASAAACAGSGLRTWPTAASRLSHCSLPTSAAGAVVACSASWIVVLAVDVRCTSARQHCLHLDVCSTSASTGRHLDHILRYSTRICWRG